MTRVERINKAISILYVNHNYSVRQIHQYLAQKQVDIDELTIASVVQAFAYKGEQKPRKKSLLEQKIERLNAALRPIIRFMAENRISYSYLVRLLDDLGVCIPGSGGRFNLNRLKKYLLRQNLYQRNKLRGNRSGLTYVTFYARLNVDSLKEYTSWLDNL